MKKKRNIQIVCWLLLLLSLSVGIINKKAEKSAIELAHDEFIELAKEVIGQRIVKFQCEINSNEYYLNERNIYRKLNQLESALYWPDEVTMAAFCKRIEISEQDSFPNSIFQLKQDKPK